MPEKITTTSSLALFGLFYFFASPASGIFSFLPQAQPAPVVIAHLTGKAILAVMLFRPARLRHTNFAGHTPDSNKRHLYSD